MCVEHIEEASALFDICSAMRLSDALPWVSAVDFEDRLEAHIDALVIGGNESLQVCLMRSIEGDAGEVFAGVSALCRRGEAKALNRVLQSLPPQSSDKIQAAGEALALEMPEPWTKAFGKLVAEGPTQLLPMAIRVVGRRRIDVGDSLERWLTDAARAVSSAAAWSLGQLGPTGQSAALRTQYDHTDPQRRLPALAAGLRQHDEAAFAQLQTPADSPAEQLPLIAFAGKPMVSRYLLAAFESRPSIEGALALGLLGDPTFVRPLLARLADEDVGAACAQALYVITGAAPEDEVREFEPVSEDELFEREREAWLADGRLPAAADGQPYGVKINQLSRDKAVWEARLPAIAARFVAGRRHRFGHPMSAMVGLKSLQVPNAPRLFRAWFIDELQVRYGIDLRTVADAPVRSQMTAIELALRELRTQAADAYKPGDWVLAGKAVDH